MGRELLRLVDDFETRLADGHPAHSNTPAAVRAVAHRGSFRGVAVTQLDRLVRDTERVGGDLGERGVVALSVGVGADVDGHAARGKNHDLRRLDQGHARSGRGGSAGAEAADLDPGRKTDSEIPAVLPPLGLLAAQLVVAGNLERLVERPVVVARVVDEAEVVGEWKLRGEVLAPDLGRVHADLVGDEVDRPLDEVRRLRSARTAIGIGRGLVGEDSDGPRGDMLPPVRAAGEQARDCLKRSEHPLIGAQVDVLRDVERHQRAVLLRAHLDVEDLAAAVGRGDEVLRPALDPFDRVAGELG